MGDSIYNAQHSGIFHPLRSTYDCVFVDGLILVEKFPVDFNCWIYHANAQTCMSKAQREKLFMLVVATMPPKSILINYNIKVNVTNNNWNMRCMNKLRVSALITLLTPFKEIYAEIIMSWWLQPIIPKFHWTITTFRKFSTNKYQISTEGTVA